MFSLKPCPICHSQPQCTYWREMAIIRCNGETKLVKHATIGTASWRANQEARANWNNITEMSLCPISADPVLLCPFCGELPGIRVHDYSPIWTRDYHIVGQYCQITHHCPSHNLLINCNGWHPHVQKKRWNTTVLRLASGVARKPRNSGG